MFADAAGLRAINGRGVKHAQACKLQAACSIPALPLELSSRSAHGSVAICPVIEAQHAGTKAEGKVHACVRAHRPDGATRECVQRARLLARVDRAASNPRNC
eukprot:6214498-Pleurochrysis_carterae.AAC.10